MMKKVFSVLLLLIVLCFTSCNGITDNYPENEGNHEINKEKPSRSCQHLWENSTCESPMKCLICGETSGSPLGHSYSSATCTSAQKCYYCGETVGDALGHQYSNGYCTRCGIKDPN